MVADPRLALSTLRSAGAGEARFTGRLTASIDEVLASPIAADSEEAARHIDGQLEVLLAETGLRADELVRVPVLFTKVPELGGLFVAATPGIPNGLSIDARTFAAPDPHAPVVGGADIFRAATERALRGVRVHWVEDIGWAHSGGGEVHCTTNAWRAVS
jgi:protein-arginine deiminase